MTYYNVTAHNDIKGFKFKNVLADQRNYSKKTASCTSGSSGHVSEIQTNRTLKNAFNC